MVRIGIIGCGMIAQRRHAPEYSANAEACLSAWYDSAPERARKLAQLYGGKVYDDWRTMIDQGAVDAVSVCTPNTTHAEISVYALLHGVHVLCEKPMATSVEDCERMVNAAETSGKLLFIGQNQRLSAAHIKARRLIASGEIGRVLTFRTVFGHSGPECWTMSANTWFFKRETAAFGAVFDLGIHKLDLISYLLNEPFAGVTAMLGTLDKKDGENRPISVDDNALIIARMRSGAIGQIAASWTYSDGEDNSTRIYGTTGTLSIYESENHPLVLRKADREAVFKGLDTMQTNQRQFSSGIIDTFISDIQASRPATISGRAVLNAMRAVFGAIESARTGRVVSFE